QYGDFRLRTFLRPYAKPLAIGLALVVTDVILTLAGPILVKAGVDRGVIRHAWRPLQIATGLFLFAMLADWFVTWAETVQTGRTAERLLFALRVRIFAHLQRLALDFYDQEMAGRVMTRMTTDVEALSNLLQNGLINAIVSLLSFVGVLVLLAVMNPQLTLATLVVVPPLVVATWWFRRRSDEAYVRAR